MIRTKIEERVLAALGAVVPAAKSVEIDPTALIRNQVDIDSMDFLEFVLAIERRFAVRVPPASYPLFATVETAVECLEQLLADAPTGPAGSSPGRR
jgi:acyl carrier protein